MIPGLFIVWLADYITFFIDKMAARIKVFGDKIWMWAEWGGQNECDR
jgi:hypothetical protein